MKSREGLFRLKEFQVEEKRRQLIQIENMITDFKTMANELEKQIEAEHNRTGISDRLHFAYSTFAKSALQRRSNLLNSIKDLETQKEAAQQTLKASLEELKKVELLSERNTLKERLEAEASEQNEFDNIALQRYLPK